MTTTDLNTGAALLHQIIGIPTLGPDGQPDGGIAPPDLDPGLRLVYADWLEETAGMMRCERCEGLGKYSVDATNPGLSAANGYSPLTTYREWRGCRACGGDNDRKGTGWLPGPGAARAEFIRVQVELAACGDDPRKPCGGYYCETYDDGTTAHRDCSVARLRRREMELLEACGSKWSDPIRSALGFAPPSIPGHGSGGAWEVGRIPVEWQWFRGFPARLTCTSRDWWGTPGQPGYGPALVRAAPLLRIDFSDRVPYRSLGSMYGWNHEDDGSFEDLSVLPDFIWDRLLGDRRHYDTEEAAREALSTGSLIWARLPPCGECKGRGWMNPRAKGLRGGRAACRPCHGLGRALS